MFQNKCRAAMQTSNSDLDQKTKWATFRVQHLNGKLGCCTCLFSCFSMFFFITAMVTCFSARFNAAHIAQTGHLPWVNPQADFVPSETPAKYEFGLYDNFLKMGFLQGLLSMTMGMFTMRTMIAKFIQREKNSNIAFRRTFYCIFAFLLFYGLLAREQGKLQDIYPTIATEMNTTIQYQEAPPMNMDDPLNFGGRNLQDDTFNLPEFLQNLKNKLQKEVQGEERQQNMDEALKQFTEGQAP